MFLQAGNGVACDGDELSGAPVGPITSIASGGHLFPPGGRYEVKVCDDDESGLIPPDSDPDTDTNGRFRVISTGFGRNGSVAAVELIVSSASAPGLLVAGNLRITGVAEIQGQSGRVHADGQLELNNARAEHSFDSSGSVTALGDPKTGLPPVYGDDPPELNSGQDPVKVPELQLSDLQPLADYNLGNDGLIRDSSATVIGDATGGPWNDWAWDPGGQRWVAGTNIPLGTYYAQGNVEVSGNPGNPGTPIALTLIAEGWISISGAPTIVPALTQGSVSYAFVAGTDLSISGNLDINSEALAFASDQLAIPGNPEIIGQVVVADLDDQPFPNPGGTNLVVLLTGGFIEISEDPTITYDDVSSGLLITTAAGWRECRGPDPTNPCQ